MAESCDSRLELLTGFFVSCCSLKKALWSLELELGGMTKNLYHGIFLNYTGFTVYDGIFFFPMDDRVLTTFSTD